LQRAKTTVSNIIYMDNRTSKAGAWSVALRDRRYCIRYPFAADVELLDLESGAKGEGVTSDISIGGTFICTSRPFPLSTRLRIILIRKGQRVEALGVVRIVKPRIGMGIEFIDLEEPYAEVLQRWVEHLSKSRS
jgi:hypothetical protein